MISVHCVTTVSFTFADVDWFVILVNLTIWGFSVKSGGFSVVVGSGKWRRWRRNRKQKRGCRGGIRARLRKQPLKPPLSSIFLTNARSIAHKINKQDLLTAANGSIRDFSVSIITEMWLHPAIPDVLVHLANHTLHRWDCNSTLGRKRGGDICIYIHNGWCTQSHIIGNHCSPDIERLSILLRPFYLPSSQRW